MPSMLKLRAQIEADLADRIPLALTPSQRMVREVLACGIPDVDAALQGGLPRGAIAELVGTNCSGRTTMAMAYAAATMRAGNVCAWIDVADAFDPESAAANGVQLERMLWVRCGRAETVPAAAVKVCEERAEPTCREAQQARYSSSCGSPHPRSEGLGMPQAISALLASHNGAAAIPARRRDKAIGTPGAANRPLVYSAEDRVEQVNSDRLPPRRGENLAVAARCAEPHSGRASLAAPFGHHAGRYTAERATRAPARDTWAALDQAIRAADLLLQSGGFSMIVMDMASTLPEFTWRIPLATWFRFRAACERTRVSLLLLTQHSCSRSSAELVVKMQTGSMEADGRVVAGMQYRVEVERQKFAPPQAKVVSICKPPQPEKAGQWRCEAAWSQAL